MSEHILPTATSYKDLLTSEETIIDDKLYSDDKTASFLDLNPHTLAVWRSCKRYPELAYTKIGRKVRYRGKAIKYFIALRTVGGNNDAA